MIAKEQQELIDKLDASGAEKYKPSDFNIFFEASNEIRRQRSAINDMAMMMRRILTECEVNRSAKQYLVDNDLMGE